MFSWINHYSSLTICLPELRLFKDGEIIAILVEDVEWLDTYIAVFPDCIVSFYQCDQSLMDRPTGEAVVLFGLAAIESASTVKEVRPDEDESMPVSLLFG
jgi:hypothetical protein